ncbi:MAG: phage head closure protein [Hyphomicrobiaceae bacterium]
MRHRLTLEQVMRDDDGCGGAEESWVAIGEMWGAVRPVRGTEREVWDQLAGNVSHEIWIRYRSGVKPAMRFRSGGRTFEVRAVIDVEERRRFLKCFAEERDL